MSQAAECLPAGVPTTAGFALPPGACDCHLHVLGPFDRYPLAAQRPYTPPPATLADLQHMMDTVGLSRVVVAHVSAHGADLSVTLDALQALGERARGTALLDTGVTPGQLDDLHRQGMRGVRLSPAYGAMTPIDEHHLRHWADAIAPLGWHIAMWPSTPDELRLLARLAPQLPSRLVLDHLASHAWYADGRPDPEGLAVLRDMLASGRTWLKLSGMYRAGAGASPWAALLPAIAPLLKEFPAQLLWASDWPFVGLYDPVQRPQTGELLDWLVALGADTALREQILVRNPEDLYGFPRWQDTQPAP